MSSHGSKLPSPAREEAPHQLLSTEKRSRKPPGLNLEAGSGTGQPVVQRRAANAQQEGAQEEPGFLDRAGEALGNARDTVVEGGQETLAFAGGLLDRVTDAVRNGTVWLLDSAEAVGYAIANWGFNVVRGAGHLMWDFFTKAPERLLTVLQHAGDGAADLARWVIEGIKMTLRGEDGYAQWLIDGLHGGAVWSTRTFTKLLDLVSVGEITSLFLVAVQYKSRDLSGTEVSEAQPTFGSSIPYGQIRIAEDSFVGKLGMIGKDVGGMGVALYHVINFSRAISTSAGSSDMAWLIHELVHVRQYEAHGSQYIPESIYAQATTGYAYGGPSALRGKSLSNFNTEQQADIIKHYYYGCLHGNMRDVLPSHIDIYRPYVQQMQRGEF